MLFIYKQQEITEAIGTTSYTSTHEDKENMHLRSKTHCQIMNVTIVVDQGRYHKKDKSTTKVKALFVQDSKTIKLQFIASNVIMLPIRIILPMFARNVQ